MKVMGLPITDHFTRGLVESWYLFCQRNRILRNKSILLQSRHGEKLDGDIFYIVKELSQNYQNYRLYLAYKQEIPTKNIKVSSNNQSRIKSTFEGLLRKYQIENVELVEINTAKYWLLLATCKYLINDDSFPQAFIKRDGQVYLHTWCTTPLKKVGLDNKLDGYMFGNVQRNIFASDYLLCPSKYMMEIIIRAFHLANLFQGQFVSEGSPRNAVFFDISHANGLKNKLNLDNKQVIAYFPTNEDDCSTKILEQNLIAIDEKLNDNQVLFVKPSTACLGSRKFKHIFAFPDGYETYDFLAIADCLVTDYSSVMFDFACSRRPIILFIPSELALQNDNLYVPVTNLPFLKTRKVTDLIDAINNGEGTNYVEDPFVEGVIKYENNTAAQNVCRLLLCESVGYSACSLENNKKENILIFVDGLPKNGLTSSVFNLINTVDLEKRNYFFSFKESTVGTNKNRIYEIPPGVGVTSVGTIDRTLTEYLAAFLYYKLNVNISFVDKLIDRCYKRNFKKHFAHINVDCFIQFPGYGRDMLQLFLSSKRKIVFAHNNMKKEVFEKKNQHRNTLVKCYQNYDAVAGISENVTATAKEVGHGKGTYVTVHNAFDYKKIQEKSLKPITFESDTEFCINTPEKLMEVLNNDKLTKFITIGRFSPEKGHFRLIDAFDRYWAFNKDCFLVIVGGYGSLFSETVAYAETKQCRQSITIIRSIDNPLPILKKCDLFILSSTYEGLGLVLLEADCLGIPVISTDIVGPRELLKQYKGTLVDDSVDGIVTGIELFSRGKVNCLNVDFKKYNNQALMEFESLLQLL